MRRYFEVGDRVYGFCNGFFGRDCYEDKICIMATNSYAVFEDLNDGFARVINYPSDDECEENWEDREYFKKATDEWKDKELVYANN